MSGESTTVTRRSVAKGAAWAVPAVVIAQAAPAMAQSVDCSRGFLREAGGDGWTTLGRLTTENHGDGFTMGCRQPAVRMHFR